MSMQTIKEFNESLMGDCKLSIEEFYANNPWDSYPRPYVIMSDYYDIKESYRVLLPRDTEELDRLHQYYMVGRLANVLKLSRIGVVAYLELDVPSRPEIETRFWGRKARAALVGAAGKVYRDEISIAHDSKVMIFDIIDDVLEFCDIEDQSIWQDFINNVAIFRDTLFMSAAGSKNQVYRWPELCQVMKAYGFEFDWTSEENQTTFLRSQDALIGL